MASREYYTPVVAVPQTLPTNEQTSEYVHVNSACCTFNKGFTSPPFSLTSYDSGQGIRITFEQSQMVTDCVCSVECVGVPSVTTPISTGDIFCPDTSEHTYDVDIDIVDEGSPFGMLFTFLDQLGNETEIPVGSLVNVKPASLNRYITLQNDSYYMEGGVSLRSASGEDLTSNIYQYQVEEYVGNEENKNTLIDWTTPASHSSPVHILRRRDDVFTKGLRPDVTYGWRVRFRSEFDDASKWSDWITVRVPDDIPTS